MMMLCYVLSLSLVISLCLINESILPLHAQDIVSQSDPDGILGITNETIGQALDNRTLSQPTLQDFGIDTQDVLNLIEITTLNRTENQNRTLYPVSHLNQTDIDGNLDWVVYDYVWKENPKHQDVEAAVAFKTAENGIDLEINKLTQLGVEIRIVNQTYLMPETRSGEISPGFLLASVLLPVSDQQKTALSPDPNLDPLFWLFR